MGRTDGSVTIERTGHYSVDYRLVPLEAVAGKTRTIPDEFMSASGHGCDGCVPAVFAAAAGEGDAGCVSAAEQ